MSSAQPCPWGHFEQAAITFCERRLCHWVVEPANTWSNIGYLIVGFLVLYSNRGTKRAELSLIGVVSILVGVGSALFHGTGTRIGEILDVSAMYLISGLFLTFYMKRYFEFRGAKLLGFYVAITSASIFVLVTTGSNGILLFATHLAACVVLELLTAKKPRPKATDYRYLRYLVGAFAVSFVAWFLDIRHIACDPDNHILGGHAVWHLTNATCLWSYYKFQEQFVETDTTSTCG